MFIGIVTKSKKKKIKMNNYLKTSEKKCKNLEKVFFTNTEENRNKPQMSSKIK